MVNSTCTYKDTSSLQELIGSSFRSLDRILLSQDAVAKLMELEAVFRAVDKDGDGKISADELMQCMAISMVEELSSEEAVALLETVDADGDGLLDLEEFVRLAEAEEEEERSRDLRAAFEMYVGDDGEGGCITPRSLKRMLSRLGASRPIEDCLAMICRFDLNGDGVLSFDEFRTMMMV